MREENESSESYPESVKDILQELSCRLCLYRHEKNARITSPSCSSTDLINKISKHLPVEVTQDREFPIWICKFCEQSLESFHKFYSKVKQVHESLTGLLSVLKNGNHGETIRLDEELNEIETTVGFARGKKVRATSLNTKSEPTRRTSRRTQARKTEHSTEGQNCSSTEKSEDPFLIEGNIQNESNVSSPFTHNKSNRPGKAGPCVVIKMEDMEESVSNDCDPDQADLPMFQGVVCVKDDDLSSLEDQDWVGQGFNFDTDSDNDLNWKPPPSEGSKNRSSKRKKPSQQTVKEDVENVTEKSDHSVEVVASQVCKKTKLRITATHGTEPKPKVPAAVRKMLREEMNARFVDFYGITCDICVKNFPSNSAAVEPVKFQTFDELCSHMQKEHDVRGYVKCCNCTMRERKRAERHMLLHTDPGSIYKCNICGKQLSSQQSFRCHILLHLPDSERPFQCNLCDRGFVSKADLNAHERQHLPEDKRLLYTCDICGSRFSYETGLVIHKQRVHENIRPHLCDLCAKSFSSRCDMERHRAQIHGNVKREQCPECGKWFKGQSILKTHMQRHKGALFQCQFCDKKYNVRSSWKAHLLIHTDVKPHKCPVCEKSFKLPGTLKMHLNQHTGDLPYVCQFCPKKFASSGNYYTHRKRMHGDEVAQLKEATEAALAASGLPPPLSVPPATVTKSISEAIARTKEIVAAKAKQAAEANTLLPSQDQVMMNVEAPVILPDVADGIVSMVVDAPHQISLTSSSSSDLRAQMVSIPLPQNSNNSVILSQPSDTSIPVTMSTINETSKTVHLIPNLKMPVGSNPGTFVAGSLKLVRLISPDGTSKLVFMKEDELTGNIASLGKISAITLDT